MAHNHYNQILHKLVELEDKLTILSKGITHMSNEVDNLTAQVKANSDVIDSAVTLISGIADRIAAAGTDPVKLKALSDELKNKDDTLAAAVVANTPAAAPGAPGAPRTA